MTSFEVRTYELILSIRYILCTMYDASIIEVGRILKLLMYA